MKERLIMKPRIALVLLSLVLAFVQPLQAQSIENIKSSVSFIYLPNARGELVPKGTGFFVGVNDTIRSGFYVYTITAKHVLWDSTAKSFPPNAWLRLNQKGGGATFVRMPMRTSGEDKNVFVHKDSTVDLVAVLGIPDREKYDFTFLPSQLVRTSQDIRRLGLGEGTDVFFPALFLPHIGEHKNYPIVRFGKLALVSDEKISWGGQLLRLYLVESISIGGHSGAPVFAWFQARAEPGTPMAYEDKRIRLIGVMKGYFEYQRPVGSRETNITPVYGSHTGISAVVPVDLMQEILFGAEAANMRDK